MKIVDEQLINGVVETSKDVGANVESDLESLPIHHTFAMSKRQKQSLATQNRLLTIKKQRI